MPEYGSGELVQDPNAVHRTGDETIAGTKSYQVAPSVPADSWTEDDTLNLVADLANLAAANALRETIANHNTDVTAINATVTALDTAALHKAGAETVTGLKKFTTAATEVLRAKFRQGPVFDVTHSAYGAVGDGIANDTAAIQAAVDACIAAGGGVVYLPTGTYLVSTLAIVGGDGLVFRGDGPLNTIIRPTGNAGTWASAVGAGTAVLDMAGLYGCLIERFTIDGTGWTGTALNAIQLYGNAGRGGVATGTVFNQVYVTNMALCRNYFAIGTDAGTYQCDNISLYDVRAIPNTLFGAATLSGALNISDTSFTVADSFGWLANLPASNFVVQIDDEQILVGTRTGTSFTGCTRGYNSTAAAAHSSGANVDRADYVQAGFAFGGPAYGNKYIYHLMAPVSLGFRYGLRVSSTQMLHFGGNLGNNGTDIYRTGPGYFRSGGWESQHSRTFVDAGPAVSVAASAVIHDFNWIGTASMATDGVIGRWHQAGSLTLARPQVWDTGGVVPTIAAAPNAPLTIETVGVMAQAQVRAFLPSATNLTRIHRAYVRCNSSGQSQAVQHLDDRAPRTLQILPFFTPVSHVNWNNPLILAGAIMGAAWQSGASQNDEVNWDLTIGAGTWTLEILYYGDGNSGIITVQLDDGAGTFSTLGTVDTYRAAGASNNRGAITGIVVDSATARRLKLKMATKNASSGAYGGYVQLLTLKRTAA